MKPLDNDKNNAGEPNSAGAYFSTLAGKILAGRKAREDVRQNLKRLEQAALVSRELGAQRIADEEIKKFIIRLVYEADGYIAAAKEGEGAYYEPLALDALDIARAAVNAWKKNENDTAAGKYLGLKGMREGIVIPRDDNPTEEGQSAGSGEPAAGVPWGAASEKRSSPPVIREKTLGILRESLRLFMIQNSIRCAGDPDAALSALAVWENAKSPQEAG